MVKTRVSTASRLSRLAVIPVVILALLLLKGTTEVFDFVSISSSPKLWAQTEAPAAPAPPPPPVLPKQRRRQPQHRRFCDAALPTQPCIFDLGMNKGQSSAFYLRDPNALVLAVEANPVLVKKGGKRFGQAKDAGKFKLVHAGIAEKKGQTLTFWVNKASDKFSSFLEDVGCRYPGGQYPKPGDHSYCSRITVKTNTCADLVRAHGTPRYLKVDVEGMDRTCLQSLSDLPREKRPRYVSKENVEEADFGVLLSLGYTKFKAVNQAVLESRFQNDPNMRGTSGPWGENAVDMFVGNNWQTIEELKARMPLPKSAMVDGHRWNAWYDLHAAMDEPKIEHHRRGEKAKRYCDGSTMRKPCIFDFGLNKGQSSAFYLRDPNAKVLAVEANPVLVKKGMKRFEYQMDNGRFKLVHAGIAKVQGEKLTFWVNTVKDKFSSLIEEVGCRTPEGAYPAKGDRTYCKRMKVNTETCAEFVRNYGTPQYLKVDVEGMDRTCLSSLSEIPKGQRPKYVSKENVEEADFEMLQNLGYTGFKVVNQAFLESKYLNDEMMRGTSGAWGEQAIDAIVGNRWQTLDELKGRLPLPKYAKVDGAYWKAWYDLHAKME